MMFKFFSGVNYSGGRRLDYKRFFFPMQCVVAATCHPPEFAFGHLTNQYLMCLQPRATTSRLGKLLRYKAVRSDVFSQRCLVS